MAILYSNTIKEERMNVVKTALNGGKLNIYSAEYQDLLVSINLENISALVVNGILTLLGTPLVGIAILTGTAEIARLLNSSGEVVAEGLTVGLAGTNLVIDAIAINTTQIVRLNSGIIIHG
jgi:hypothetical protein